MADETPWEGKALDAAATFAEQCADLRNSNPYDLAALDSLINTLMTELWDHGFSQTEIRTAFESAVAALPLYAAGEENQC